MRVNPTNDVQGISKHNDFRDWGITTRLTYDTPWGQVRTGLWFDYIANEVTRTRVDFTRGGTVYTTSATAAQFNQFYRTRLTTIMPYIEYAWKPLPQLTITPGVRFSSVKRDLDAVVLSGAPLGKSNHTWNEWQPSVDVHYQVTPNWTAYAQAAVGFLAPPLNTLQTTSPVGVTPQSTVNYQLGTSWQTERLSIGGDVYYIPFQNYITSQSIAGVNVYSNQGSALYQGIEVEGTYKLLHNVSFYANGSLNDARFSNGAHIYQAPQHVAAAGLIYDQNNAVLERDNVWASFLVKNVGKQFGVNTNTPKGPTASNPIAAYSNVDLAVGYKLPLAGGRSVRLALNFYNIFDDHSIIGYAGATAAKGTALYWTDPGFSTFFSVSGSF